MALRFTQASNETASALATVATAAPVTIAAWVYPVTTTAQQFAVTLYKASDLNQHFTLGYDATNWFALARDGGTPGSSLSGTVATNTWTHAGAVFASSTSRTIYKNGVAGTANTTSIVPAGIDSIALGKEMSSGDSLDGSLAEVAIWSVALSASEMASLAAGCSPLLIRPASLLAYYPLGNGHRTGTTTIDRWRNRYDLTESNTPTVADHPRVYASG